MSHEDEAAIRRTHRTTIDDAGEQGIGTPAPGIEPTAPSYTDETGVADLGVNEPVPPSPLRGDEPPPRTRTRRSSSPQ